MHGTESHEIVGFVGDGDRRADGPGRRRKASALVESHSAGGPTEKSTEMAAMTQTAHDKQADAARGLSSS